MNLSDLVWESWQNTHEIDEEEVRRHVSNYSKMEELLPDQPRFFVALNLHNMEFFFLSKTHETVTGYNNEEVARKGTEFQLEQIHPDDAPFIVKDAYQKFRDCVQEHPVEERQNLLLQTNYRFRHKNGQWLHLMEHVSIIKLDDQGDPKLILTNVYQLPVLKVFRGNILIKRLENNNNYTTLYSQEYPHSKSKYQLSQREKEVVELIVKGLKGREIGERLHITYETVRTHRKNILSKLDLKTSGELAAIAISKGLI